MSVDGTDFEIEEPGPFIKKISKLWYSHKFKGPGLKYEVGISILNGDIVWIHGPFNCGMNDLQVFRDGMVHYFQTSERVEADDGYQGDCPQYTKTPGGITHLEKKRGNDQQN